jgi:hypothetical protein
MLRSGDDRPTSEDNSVPDESVLVLSHTGRLWRTGRLPVGHD